MLPLTFAEIGSGGGAMSYDLIIVGMGSGGMVAAEFAARLDLKVAVVERDRVGGDCLWTGCVPSKALLASAKVAHHMRTAGAFGIEPVEPVIDSAKVFDRVRAVQRSIAETDDDPERYRAMGLDLRIGRAATITTPQSVRVGDEELEGKRILLCTGSRPTEPPIAGLAVAGYLTSESLWEIERAPASLVVIGGGPVAIELAQAFRRLGTTVTVLQRGQRVLPRDEPELVDRLVARLRGEGVDIRLNADAQRVTVEDGRKVVHGTQAGAPARWAAEELIVATGRRPNVEGLGLETLGIAVTPRGVEVDERSRTSVPTIYAVGDLAGRHLFTHSAASEGVKAIRDMFFPGKGRFDSLVPWATFTDPELAHAGLTTAEARERHDDAVEVWRMELAHSDRARADGAEDGLIVVVCAKKKIVGAHILAPAAGELIQELAGAIERGTKFADLAGQVHVYPTLSTSIAQLAGEAAFESAQRYKWLVRT
jgi:pyruvate/2-oxoglutarate dehydrogenase complex dihydrolipoamide dehydrogenase (E3) component